MNKSNRYEISTKEKALLSGNAFFKKWKWAIAIILFLGLVLVSGLLILNPTYQLVIERMEDGEVLWSSQIQENEWFAHEYIHSVEKSPVLEKFKFDESGEILTMESWTRSFGAGMPFERQGTVEMKDGYYISRDLNRPVHGGSLKLQPSDLFPHQFFFKDEVVTLSEPPFIHEVIEIKVDKEGFIKRISNLF